MEKNDLEKIRLKSSIYQDNYEIENSLYNSYFGEIFIIRSKIDNKKILVKEKISLNFKEFEKDLNQIKERIKLDNINIINLYDYSTNYNNETFLVTAYYEYPNYTLLDELNKRKNEGVDFTIEELNLFSIQILSALSYLEIHKSIHGDLRPEYIYFDKKFYVFKLIDRIGNFLPYKDTQLHNLNNSKKLYLSPEMFNWIIKKKKTKVNFLKSEIFSFGLILLEIGLLEDLNGVYDKENKEFNKDLLEFYIKKFENKYKNDQSGLISILRFLLIIDYKDRLKARNILEVFNVDNKNDIEEHTVIEEVKSDLKKYKPFNYKSDQLYIYSNSNKNKNYKEDINSNNEEENLNIDFILETKDEFINSDKTFSTKKNNNFYQNECLKNENSNKLINNKEVYNNKINYQIINNKDDTKDNYKDFSLLDNDEETIRETDLINKTVSETDNNNSKEIIRETDVINKTVVEIDNNSKDYMRETDIINNSVSNIDNNNFNKENIREKNILNKINENSNKTNNYEQENIRETNLISKINENIREIDNNNKQENIRETDLISKTNENSREIDNNNNKENIRKIDLNENKEKNCEINLINNNNEIFESKNQNFEKNNFMEKDKENIETYEDNEEKNNYNSNNLNTILSKVQTPFKETYNINKPPNYYNIKREIYYNEKGEKMIKYIKNEKKDSNYSNSKIKKIQINRISGKLDLTGLKKKTIKIIRNNKEVDEVIYYKD